MLSKTQIKDIRIMASLIKNIVISFRDFIFPPVCFLCNQRLREDEERICNNCWSSFSHAEQSSPAFIELTSRFQHGEVVGGFTTCYIFEKEGKFQEAIHLLKYRNIKSVGVRLGNEIGRKIVNDTTIKDIDIIAPIPLHKLKQRERGYNQSEFLCKGVSEVTKIEFTPNLIVRGKYTESQTKLNLEERKLNVAEAFSLNPKYHDAIAGKTIFLIDDVITTGSTIEAAARVLKQNGASRIYAASAGLAK
jgi:ComF family protein